MAAHEMPGVTVALALAAGMIAQSLARHLKLPGIVLLLAAGVLLGPDFAGAVQPASLGRALHILVGFAVAVILFEGGMNLDVKRLLRQAHVIRRLLTVGAVLTAAGGTLAARLVMGWGWSTSVLFGTLVIVTGPTVVTPLLRRIKVRHKVGTILEAEGVLIDAVGAVAAVMTLEVVLSVARTEHAGIHWDAGWLLLQRLAFGVVAGIVAGGMVALLLRHRGVVPDGLENVLTLSLVLAAFQVGNLVLEESGIMTVTIAGMVVGNMRTHVQRDLLEFKEQLTVMLIGMLFVLLAADVRLEEVRALGWRGAVTVLVLMIVIRPLNVLVCTHSSDLTWREKTFLGWLAPRGIVAAAVASWFAQSLGSSGVAGGKPLEALVFLVIGITVLVQGLTGGPVARWLGLRRASDHGYAILGANELGHALGRLLRDGGEEVVFLDSNAAACHVVEQDGFKVVFGSALDERALLQAGLDDRAACIGVTPNEEANVLFVQHAMREFKLERAYVAMAGAGNVVNETVVERGGGAVLFGARRDLELWALRLRRGIASIEAWRRDPRDDVAGDEAPFDMPELLCLPLVVDRSGRVFPANGEDGWKAGDTVRFALFDERLDEARAWLAKHGWTAVDESDRPGPAERPHPGPTGTAG